MQDPEGTTAWETVAAQQNDPDQWQRSAYPALRQEFLTTAGRNRRE